LHIAVDNPTGGLMKLADQITAEGILFTDQYQLTMAQLYFRQSLHEEEVQFDHFFRDYPDYGIHQAGYCVSAGLETLIDWMGRAHFRADDIALLRAQRDRTGGRIFGDDFLTWLEENGNFDRISLQAIPEGRVVHPNVPLTSVQGPLAMAQILETSLLNHINFETLIATKAARIHEYGRSQLFLEFGLRRAHGRGGVSGTRAALIGGADFSSNVGTSHVLGFPPKGTHAHSMVQLFIALGRGELEAFRAYADVYPDECLLLVDTVNTLQSGVPNAIRVFEELKRGGHQPMGVRIDSGDLAYLSIQTARMMDKAGFPDTSIVLSNDLDELTIWQILTQIESEAPRYGLEADRVIHRLVFGVGTHLITSWGEPALGGVYKLVSVCHQGSWIPAIKVSESPAKTPTPGHKRVWRVYDRRGHATADVLSMDSEDLSHLRPIKLRHPSDHTKYRTLREYQISEVEPLLVEVLDKGQRVRDMPSMAQIRAQREADIARLDPGVKRLMNPHIYHVSLTQALWDLKQGMIDRLSNEDAGLAPRHEPDQSTPSEGRASGDV
jgi:nicotinate phosphoribosyltransferase